MSECNTAVVTEIVVGLRLSSSLCLLTPLPPQFFAVLPLSTSRPRIWEVYRSRSRSRLISLSLSRLSHISVYVSLLLLLFFLQIHHCHHHHHHHLSFPKSIISSFPQISIHLKHKNAVILHPTHPFLLFYFVILN